MVVTLAYQPRPLQADIHRGMDTHRFGGVVCHRRFGKTVLAINHLLIAALECKRERPRFGFIAPTYAQGKAIAWDYLMSYSAPIPGVKPLISELSISLPNGSQVRIFGADNPDSLRGLYFDGVVLDEYGLMPPRIFSEVLRPSLSDRQGWALFLGTPAGKNQFYDVIQQARKDDTWFHAEFKASQTGYVLAEELVAARKDMTEDEYAQEYECSFEAAVKGAIYTKELSTLRSAGRICNVPYDPALPVETDWDLGVGDATAIIFSQSLRSGEVRIIDYHEASGEGFPYYARILSDKGYTYGRHYAPHDIAVRELGSGKSRLEVAAGFGLRFDVTPRIHGVAGVEVEEGINAARLLLARCWFDQTRAAPLIEALMHYRRDYNQRLNEFKATPVHDWACVTGDTNVLTRYGMHQIQYLPQAGEVLTPCGWKAFENPRITRRAAPLVAVTFDDGLTVRCTPEHRFLTDSGWRFASDLRTGSLIQSSLTHSSSTSTGASIGSGLKSATSRAVGNGSIATYGRQLSDLSRRVATFITETATRAITPSPIWNVSQPLNTCLIHGESIGLVAPSTLPPRLGQRPQNGTLLRSAARGIDDTPSAVRAGRNGSENRSPVNTAEWSFRHWFARVATRRNTAPIPVKHLRIASVTPLVERADVWCLTVPDGHMWSLENGAVTHNSHGSDAFRGLAVRHQIPREKQAAMAPPPMPTGVLAWMS